MIGTGLIAAGAALCFIPGGLAFGVACLLASALTLWSR